jgi:mRNA interferase MazF
MGQLVKGSIVVIPFPFSDLSGSKKRPALVLADLIGNDVILCQITSQNSPNDIYAIPCDNSNLQSGLIISASYIRPNRIFTADKNMIIKTVAVVNDSTYDAVISTITDLIER